MDWWWALRLIVPPVLLIVVLTLAVAQRQRRMSRLEELWGWLGPGQRRYGAGCSWQGEVSGRRVEVTWFEGNTRLEVAARPRLEVGFGRKGQPAELADVKDSVSVELGALVGYGHERVAVKALAVAEPVYEALMTLLDGQDGSLRSVRLEPVGKVTWFARNLREAGLTLGDARRWVAAVVVVAEASERSAVRRVEPPEIFGCFTPPSELHTP